jgi:hypothetical protein
MAIVRILNGIFTKYSLPIVCLHTISYSGKYTAFSVANKPDSWMFGLHGDKKEQFPKSTSAVNYTYKQKVKK